MTDTDSLAKVVAELRNGHDWRELADRIERLDAEMRKDNGELRASLVRACNATDGGCTETVSNEFLSHVGEEVELCITDLRARLAACEKDAERYRYFRDGTVPIKFDGEWWIPSNPIDGSLSGPTLDEMVDAAIATQSSAKGVDVA